MGGRGDGAATLADALRTYRRAAGLSQEGLAERSCVSVRTIRNIESGRVSAPRFSSVRALADALGVDGVDRIRFSELGVGDGDSAPADAFGSGGDIPPILTPIVGRVAELAALVELLSTGGVRLLTLTGMAGVGKSRLAMELVRRLAQAGRRTCWVPLASINDAKLVLDAVAHAVGAPSVDADTVARAVGRQPTLLALDNLEHLDGAGEVLADFVSRAPSTTVLATSRAPVGVPGEHEWLVGPLDVPPSDVVEPSSLEAVGSVQLLVERVRAALPGFELTPANARDAGELCRLLDGLPLAVELAAKQWRVRGGAGLVESVRRDPLALRDISDPALDEHASLLNALGASCALLNDAERHTFECMAMFPDDWAIDAAIAVAGSDAAVGHVDRLLALGLISTSAAVDRDTEPRFTMLPTIRSFARSSARRAGTDEAAVARHAEYFREWLTGVAVSEPSATAALERERHNLRAALDWLTGHAPPQGLEVAVSLYLHWRRRGRDEEGLTCLQELLAKIDDHDLLPPALNQAATLAHVTGRFQLASQLAARSLAEYRTRADRRGCAEALGTLGMIAVVTDALGAVAHCQAAVAEAEQLPDARLLTWSLQRLAISLAQVGRLDDAVAAISRARELAIRHDLRASHIQALVRSAWFQFLRGELVVADLTLDEAAPLFAPTDEVLERASWLAHRAVVSVGLGDDARAASVVAEITALARESEVTVVADYADWARGELSLARGNHVEANEMLRPALAKGRPLGLPLGRIVLLAGLALAATDIDTAALAVSAAGMLCERYGIALPATPAHRLDTVRQRWIAATSAAEWADRIAAASTGTFESTVRQVTQPR